MTTKPLNKKMEYGETRSVNIEQAQQHSYSQYLLIMEDIPALVCSYLPCGEITFINGAYCNYFEQSFDALVGSNFLSLIPDSKHKYIVDAISDLSIKTPTMSHEHQVLSPNGDIRWHRWHISN